MLFLEHAYISKLSTSSQGQYSLFAPPRDACARGVEYMQFAANREHV